MFKKVFITLLVFSVFSTKINAGIEYIHGIGAGFDMGLSGTSNGISLQYLARLNFVQMSDDMSIGVQATPYLGYNFTGSFLNEGISIGPELSFGPAATKSSNAPIGFGISPIYNLGLMHLTGVGLQTASSIGANAAFRFAVGDNPMAVNLNFLSSLETGGGQAMSIRYAFYFK